MPELINTTKRQLIPRWHTSRKLEFLQASKVGGYKFNSFDASDFQIEQKKIRWNEDRTLSNATELFVSLQLANLIDAPDYKRTHDFLLDHDNEISSALRNLLQPKLKRIDPSSLYCTNRESLHQIIRSLKHVVKNYPYDSLSWNDLSFYYAIIGQENHSRHCMEVAYNLYPTHPFIARSYARLLVHYGEPEKALYILKKTGRLREHPEILSADIAIRLSFDIGKGDITTAKRLIDKFNDYPCIISELSASLGTLEIKNGSYKKAKNFLGKSLISPTENAIAQLKWLSQQYHVHINTNQRHFNSLEADAIAYYNNQNYEKCRDVLINAHEFQPFSGGALEDAGYISLIALDDPHYVKNFSEMYIDIVNHNFTSLNNYVVAKLQVGQMQNIDCDYQMLKSLITSDYDRAVFSATFGLYLYKINNINDARTYYEASKKYFKSINHSRGLTSALIYQGESEINIDNKKAQKIFEEAGKEAKKIVNSPELNEKIKRDVKQLSRKISKT